MTVAELKAALAAYPDDMEVEVRFGRREYGYGSGVIEAVYEAYGKLIIDETDN